MRKQIKKIGNSAGLIFSLEEMKGYSLKIGDFVDISDMVKVIGTKKKKVAVGTKEKKKKESMDDLLERLPQ